MPSDAGVPDQPVQSELPNPVPAPEPAAGSFAADDQERLIGIEDFARVDLRVARVISAERHPKADRLLKLQVDLGSETRQIVAGIAAAYRPEDLVGRLIVVVANLKPARLRGEVSQGMLLAGSAGEMIAVLTPDRELPPGAEVH